MATHSLSRLLSAAVAFILLVLAGQPGHADDNFSIPDAMEIPGIMTEYPSFAVSTAQSSPSLSGRQVHAVPVDPVDTDLFHIPLIGDLSRAGIRTAAGDGGRFSRLNLYAFYFDFDLPESWSPLPGLVVDPRLTFEVGQLRLGEDHRLFASLGPALRISNQRWRMPVFMDVGLSPTVIDGAEYEDQDFGTSFNFTSHVAIGTYFGQQRSHSVSIRYQHISNGGISSNNPGVNMIGLDFAFWAKKR